MRPTALALLLAAGTPVTAAPPAAVTATVETTLETAGGRIRQFAFDANPATYFVSKDKCGPADHFTLVFDAPVALKTVTVVTGRPNGDDVLAGGVLEVSADGTAFEKFAAFAAGTARGTADKRTVKAVRVRATDDKQQLVVREITVDSEPAVTSFKYPVEFVADTTDAPELKAWAEKAARVCEREYPMICETLSSADFHPATLIPLTLRANYDGVAMTQGARITGSAKYFKSHQGDVGAMVHEAVHVVQAYRGRGNPGWLVEGVADYVRFFKYEPGKIGRLNPDRVRYDGAYRQSAAFLDYVAKKYDKDIVKTVNGAMRAGEYKDTIWKDRTGHTAEELGREWKTSLVK